MENSWHNLASLVPYLKKRYEPANTWDEEDIVKYLAWGAYNDFLFIARNDDESVAGVALARPVTSFPEDLLEHDRKGKIAHINFLVADNERAFMLLGFTILNAFKNCHTVTFNRLKNGISKKRSYPYTQVRKTLFNTRDYYG